MSEQDLHRRLTLPKFLFKHAQGVLARPVSHSCGLATSLLQDAVEIFLRVLAAHHKVEVDRFATFDKLLNKVSEGEGLGCVGEHKASLNRLNTARVAFKHEGLGVVNDGEVRAFVNNVEAFLNEVCDTVLGIDFASLSMGDAIGHRRTQNWLAKAQAALDTGLYAESVAHSAGALASYFHHSNIQDPAILVKPIDPREIRYGDFEDWTGDHIVSLRTRLDLFTRGVDVARYDKFMTLTPRTDIMLGGDIIQKAAAQSIEASWEDARFCIDFVVDAAFALRESRVPLPRRQAQEDEERVRVHRCCDVVVNPRASSPEIVRQAQNGEEFLLAPRRRRIDHTPEFQRVIDDGDFAYVRRDCVEPVGEQGC
ncbi:MAG: hypothetical protein OXG44_06175 [Gammaproteobacteria bacterium]|nr:hypothetical protein [Gammaproteobacteria bacterium]